MKPLEQIRTIADNPNVYGRRYKADTGKKIVGYLCSYTPEELILAAGTHPLRLLGANSQIHLADAHLQTYCCSLVRGVLEDALSGESDFLDGVVFPHTCDSIQRLSDIWRMNIPFGFHADVVLPVKLDTDSARQYMIDILRRFRADLEGALHCTITDDHLQQAIRTTNDIRAALRKMYELRQDTPEILGGQEVYNLLKASMVMDRGHFLAIIRDVLGDMQQGKAGAEKSARKRLVLAGGICNHPDIYSFIEEAGGAVVWDDFCTGSRYFEGLIPADGDPVWGIAQRLLERVVCPAKHAGLTARAGHLRQMVRDKEARGVIFVFLKFCDPHAFDYPHLKQSLDQDGIPSMLLEVEYPLPPAGQLKTRIEAFLEML